MQEVQGTLGSSSASANTVWNANASREGAGQKQAWMEMEQAGDLLHSPGVFQGELGHRSAAMHNAGKNRRAGDLHDPLEFFMHLVSNVIV